MNMKRTTGNPIDVRIILAVLWAAGMLCSLNGDTYRLNDPVVLRASLENTGSITITGGLLLAMSLVFVVPILMSVLTLTLRNPTAQWVNRILGIVYAVVTLTFWILGFVLRSAAYDMVWSSAQLGFAILVVRFAWKRLDTSLALNNGNVGVHHSARFEQ